MLENKKKTRKKMGENQTNDNPNNNDPILLNSNKNQWIRNKKSSQRIKATKFVGVITKQKYRALTFAAMRTPVRLFTGM